MKPSQFVQCPPLLFVAAEALLSWLKLQTRLDIQSPLRIILILLLVSLALVVIRSRRTGVVGAEMSERARDCGVKEMGEVVSAGCEAWFPPPLLEPARAFRTIES